MSVLNTECGVWMQDQNKVQEELQKVLGQLTTVVQGNPSQLLPLPLLLGAFSSSSLPALVQMLVVLCAFLQFPPQLGKMLPPSPPTPPSPPPQLCSQCKCPRCPQCRPPPPPPPLPPRPRRSWWCPPSPPPCKSPPPPPLHHLARCQASCSEQPDIA